MRTRRRRDCSLTRFYLVGVVQRISGFGPIAESSAVDVDVDGVVKNVAVGL